MKASIYLVLATLFWSGNFVVGQHTSALNASLITAANPALIVVMAIVLLGEKPGLYGWMGIVLGLAGVLLVLTRGELHRAFSITFNTGELIMIGAITVWGLYTIIARRLGLPAIAATAVQVVMATVVLCPVALAAGALLASRPKPAMGVRAA